MIWKDQLKFLDLPKFYIFLNNFVDKYICYFSDVNLKSVSKNVIDPVKLLFDHKILGKPLTNLIEYEIIRKKNKTNLNLIGYFHQYIFTCFKNNEWIIPKKGFDLINKNKNIYVEIKNKHNTMNSGASQKIFIDMQNQILKIRILSAI